ACDDHRSSIRSSPRVPSRSFLSAPAMAEVQMPMRTLYHHPLSPFARKVCVVLAEKRIEVALEVEKFWERRPEFLALDPAGEVPVLIEEDGIIIAQHAAICEYLEETQAGTLLLGTNVYERAEVRRLVAWFDDKFNREVTENLVGEKLVKRF